MISRNVNYNIIKCEEHGQMVSRWGILGFKKEVHFFYRWDWWGLWKGTLKSWGQHGKVKCVRMYWSCSEKSVEFSFTGIYVTYIGTGRLHTEALGWAML